jgi:ketosteroid isomerase-like protein
VVSEESTTPDLVGRVRDLFVSASRGDFDAIASFFAPGAVWDNSRYGLEIVEGLAAVRRLSEEWFAAYEGLEFKPEEIVDVGNGVVFAVFSQHARLAGSTARVRLRQAAVAKWADGLAVRLTMYPESDIDEARAAAERIAKERG